MMKTLYFDSRLIIVLEVTYADPTTTSLRPNSGLLYRLGLDLQVHLHLDLELNGSLLM